MNTLNENLVEDAVILGEVKEDLGPQKLNNSNPSDQGGFGQPADGNSAKSGMMDTVKNVLTVQTILKVMGELSKKGGITPDLLNKLTALCNDSVGSLHPRFKVMFLLSELLAAGYKLAFDDENREINENQVNALHNDVLTRPGKCFSEAAKVISARKLLEEGKSLSDINGNKLTLDTPDIVEYMVIIDGQHRVMVCSLDPEVNLWMEFIDIEGFTSNQYIVVLNNLRKNHTGGDQKHMVKHQYAGQATLFDEMDTFKKAYGVTDKFSEAALCGKVDQFKKAELAKVQSGEKTVDAKYMVDSAKAEMAYAVMDIAKARFGSDKETWKLFKKYQFPLSVWDTYEGKPDDEKKGFLSDICSFIKYAQEDVINSVLADIDDKSKLAISLRRELSTYMKAMSEEDMILRDAEITCLLETTKSSRNANPTVNPNSKEKAIASGTFSEVLANMTAIAKQKEEAAQKKEKAAKKKAQKADAKKAEAVESEVTDQGESGVPTPALETSKD